MQPEVRVAVVMPAFNAERYLAQAVDSVLGQTVARLQLVIVDDGSTDASLRIARSYRDPRVQVLSVANGGPARARNTGVAAAAPAPFVAFLDADDLWDPEKLEQQLRFLEEHPGHVAVGCRMRYISPSGKRLGHTGTVLDEAALAQVAQGRFFPFPMSSILVRRSAFERLGGFDERFRYPGSEDLDFCARLAQLGPIQCVTRTLGSYRIHAQSAMARERARILLEARYVPARIERAAQGNVLTWEEFIAGYRPSWNEQRENRRQLLYRAAAVHRAEGNWLRAIAMGTVGLAIAPVFTLKRLLQQTLRLRHR